MQSTPLSFQSILTALDLDPACLALLEQAPARDALLRAYSPDAVYAAISAIGDTLNATPQATRLAEHLEERINIVAHKLKFVTTENRPRVLFLADVSPVQVNQNAYIQTVIQIAGGLPLALLAEAATADAIVIAGEKSASQLLAELPGLLAAPEWAQAPAVVKGNVFIIQHPGHLRQPGALIADDIEIVAEILHPKQFFFGRDEDAWMKFEGF